MLADGDNRGLKCLSVATSPSAVSAIKSVQSMLAVETCTCCSMRNRTRNCQAEKGKFSDSSLVGHFQSEPTSGVSPITVRSCRGNTQHLCGLGIRQPCEDAKFHQLRLPTVLVLQFLQCLVSPIPGIRNRADRPGRLFLWEACSTQANGGGLERSCAGMRQSPFVRPQIHDPTEWRNQVLGL